MMEAVSTFEMSANFYRTTQRNIPEDSHHHTRRREKLKSHHVTILMIVSSPEDGGSMFLRTFGVYLQVHRVLLPLRPNRHSHHCEDLKFDLLIIDQSCSVVIINFQNQIDAPNQ
jgi:hypothetical protein